MRNFLGPDFSIVNTATKTSADDTLVVACLWRNFVDVDSMELKFRYLPARGQAIGIRRVLRHLQRGGVTVSFEESAAFAKSAAVDGRPFPVLSPVLEVREGSGDEASFVLQHAGPILRFLAESAGWHASLSGKERALVDMLAAEADDITQGLVSSDWYALSGDGTLSGAALEAARATYFRDHVRPRLLVLQSWLTKGAGAAEASSSASAGAGAGAAPARFFVGASVSAADVAVLACLERINGDIPGCLWVAPDVAGPGGTAFTELGPLLTAAAAVAATLP